MSDDARAQPRHNRDVWVEFYSAALTGVLTSRPNFTDDMAVRLAAKIADQAIVELQNRDAKPEYQKIFAGAARA
jgi:hypothetical protein